MAQKDSPSPPKPPEIRRRFEPTTEQLIGVGLLLLCILPGIFGVFGTATNRVITREAPLQLEVSYPQRTLYGRTETIEVNVTNTGTENLDFVVVRFSRGFLDSLSPTFKPGVDNILSEAYEVELNDVRPNQTRAVLVEVHADAYWRHEGFVEAAASGTTVRTHIHSFIFP